MAELNTLSTLLVDANLEGYWRMENAVALDATSIPTTNLKAYYKFDTGALTTDSSGNSHTLSAVSDPAETTGKINGAANFDGNDGYSTTNHADLNVGTELFSSGCWVKTTASGSSMSLIHFQPVNPGWALGISSTGYPFFYRTDGTNTNLATANKTVNDGNWHHLVVVKESATSWKTYIDGVLDNNNTTNIPGTLSNANDKTIACKGGSAEFFTGDLDEVFFFNGTALTASQVAEIYSLGYDSSGNANHLTNVNQVAETTGKYGGAGDFEASSSQYLYCGDSASLDISTAITIAGWIKPESIGTNHIIIKGRQDNGSNTNYGFNIQDTDELRFYYYNSAYQLYVTSGAGVVTGVWQHVAATFTFGTGSSIKIYVNGSAVASGSWTSGTGNVAAVTNNERLQVGTIRSTTAVTEMYDGVIDDLCVFSRVLTPAEILQLYQETATNKTRMFLSF